MHMQVPPPTRSSEPAADIEGFFKLVEQAFNEYCQVQNVPEGTAPVFVHSFPSERLSARKPGAGPDQAFDVITHHVASSTMAATSNSGDRVPFKPSRYQEEPHPDKAGYNLITYGWEEQTQVIFTVWSKSNEVADALANWFHKFLMKYAHFYQYFAARGVRTFRYEGRLEDDTQERESQELQRRRLMYSFRLQYLDSFEAPQIREITPHVGITGNLPHPRPNNLFGRA